MHAIKAQRQHAQPLGPASYRLGLAVRMAVGGAVGVGVLAVAVGGAVAGAVERVGVAAVAGFAGGRAGAPAGVFLHEELAEEGEEREHVEEEEAGEKGVVCAGDHAVCRLQQQPHQPLTVLCSVFNKKDGNQCRLHTMG